MFLVILLSTLIHYTTALSCTHTIKLKLNNFVYKKYSRQGLKFQFDLAIKERYIDENHNNFNTMNQFISKEEYTVNRDHLQGYVDIPAIKMRFFAQLQNKEQISEESSIVFVKVIPLEKLNGHIYYGTYDLTKIKEIHLIRENQDCEFRQFGVKLREITVEKDGKQYENYLLFDFDLHDRFFGYITEVEHGNIQLRTFDENAANKLFKGGGFGSDFNGDQNLL